MAQWLNWIEQPPSKGSIRLLKLFHTSVFIRYYCYFICDDIILCIVLFTFVYGFFGRRIGISV